MFVKNMIQLLPQFLILDLFLTIGQFERPTLLLDHGRLHLLNRLDHLLLVYFALQTYLIVVQHLALLELRNNLGL